MRGLFARTLATGSVLTLGMAVMVATPGFAQIDASNPTSIGSAAQRTVRGSERAAAAKPQVAPPPVLPGTKVAPEAAAPTQSAADMSPTEALFDAINRGDLGAARDAVNRGAELNGQNILGLTPLELSVDLGRNDISFMLLSMREADTTSRTLARTGKGPGGQDRGNAMFHSGAAPRAVRARVTAVSDTPAEEPVTAGSPRLFSGNGGAPIPAAGFVGFDAGRR